MGGLKDLISISENSESYAQHSPLLPAFSLQPSASCLFSPLCEINAF